MLRSKQTTQQNTEHQSAQFPANPYQRISPVEYYFRTNANGVKMWHTVANTDAYSHMLGISITKESHSLEQVKSKAVYFSYFISSLLRGVAINSMDDIYYGDLTKYPSGYKNGINRHINWAGLLDKPQEINNTVYGAYGKDDSALIPF